MMSGETSLSAFPDGDNIFQWTGTITGGAGTVSGRLLGRGSSRLPHSVRGRRRHALPPAGSLHGASGLSTARLPNQSLCACASAPTRLTPIRLATPCAQVYEGLTFKLSLKFPTSYPYEAPQVTFLTPCFHPNVDQYGNICLDILKARAPTAHHRRRHRRRHGRRLQAARAATTRLEHGRGVRAPGPCHAGACTH